MVRCFFAETTGTRYTTSGVPDTIYASDAPEAPEQTHQATRQLGSYRLGTLDTSGIPAAEILGYHRLYLRGTMQGCKDTTIKAQVSTSQSLRHAGRHHLHTHALDTSETLQVKVQCHITHISLTATKEDRVHTPYS